MTRCRSRPWWQRAASVCLAVWLVVAGMDLPVLHLCAMHGVAHRVGYAGAPGSSAGHAEQAGGSSAGQVADREQVPAHAGAACTCLGACSGATPQTPPPPPALVLDSAVAAAAVVPGRPAHEYVAAWADFVLPFSTAPPAARPA